MQFIFDNGVYKVARITGPQHNFLGVRLDDSESIVSIEALPIKNSERVQIEQHLVLTQVIDGLREVNAELGTCYYISQILFIPSDSPSPSVYKFLTIELIRRIENKGDFLVA
ncbi:hypothetical protein [Pseudoduganella namucuonensis]|uniref:hypothetical protein n=1 Tax=Pseudoduganella namucuonensis TaxID=1035707 RepID=UPI000A982A76|nr:hypothetical protein [Pseudoduganella namucuonensis]